ncbi:MAG: hypothetical protein AAGK32_09360, partial [Actinomycetota bacterium]
MSRRIDVELTSDRGDGTWTWRAAGAKQPKGDLAADLLPDGAAVGDELRAEADFDVDGITIVSVAPPKQKKAGPETLEILGSGQDAPGVTTTWVDRKGKGGGKGKGRGRGRGKGRGDRDGGRDRRGGRSERPPPPRPPHHPHPPPGPPPPPQPHP